MTALVLGKLLELNRCPHCSIANPNLGPASQFKTNNLKGGHERFWLVYACKRCGGVVVAGGIGPDKPVQEMFPTAPDVDSALPAPARAYLQQALASIHAPAGAVLLAASAVDAMLKVKGYTDGSLYSRIDKAKTAHLITEDMAAWAHQVRLDANDQRHADDDAELPDDVDARRAVEFALAFAQFLFVLPARVTRGLKGEVEATTEAPSEPPVLDLPDRLKG